MSDTLCHVFLDQGGVIQFKAERLDSVRRTAVYAGTLVHVSTRDFGTPEHPHTLQLRNPVTLANGSPVAISISEDTLELGPLVSEPTSNVVYTGRCIELSYGQPLKLLQRRSVLDRVLDTDLFDGT